MSLLRLWRTVRYLKPVQLYGRVQFRLARPSPDLSPAPPRRDRTGAWRVPAARVPSLVGPGQFRLLEETAALADIGWDDPAVAKLWRYNLHYFDDLNAAGAGQRGAWHQALIAEWIAANPPARGTGWEPYPTSLRVVNWVKFALVGGALGAAAEHSLAVQARWLMRRIEWHLLGNHLFANAKALVFAGLFFTGVEAERWLAQGCRILAAQLPEQFLPDGGQFELSPMYHALAVEDLLDLINLGNAYPATALGPLAAPLRARATAAIGWLATMSHAGGIGFFNDAAFGVAPDNAELNGYAARLGIDPPPPATGATYLAAAGYARLAAGDAVALVDLARVGPEYLPGHAHADTLSFEFSLRDQRIFVNSGTGEYGDGPERQRQRGTAAHNTVVVAGQNSSEVWAGFRVGRRAHSCNVRVGEEAGAMFAEGAHDGYRVLPGAPLVHRRVELAETRLVVKDNVRPAVAAEARYHLHPDIRIAGQALLMPDGRRLRLGFEGGPWRVEPSTWHPRFGLSLANQCLVLALSEGHARLTVDWG